MGNVYDFQMMLQDMEEMMGMSLVATLIGEVPSLMISAAVYVFTALALYAIAKRRGINNPWLAWIPFANSWLLGCIADQYRAVARGEIKYRRRVLLWTEIICSASALIMLVLVFVMLFNILAFTMGNLDSLGDAMPAELLNDVMGPMVGMVVMLLVMFPVAIVNAVFSFIALHDIYKSCDPSNATVYLVLSIFIAYAQPILLFICRNKDYGMPVRVAPQPACAPSQPVCEQPAAPTVEPWEQKEE